jgi:hypothetical protein
MQLNEEKKRSKAEKNVAVKQIELDAEIKINETKKNLALKEQELAFTKSNFKNEITPNLLADNK